MATTKDKTIVLLPIKPQYANSIILGNKKVEFRKIKFQKQVNHVVIYASNPIQKVLGYFEVAYIEENTPKKIWEKYKDVGGILYNDFVNYYSCSKTGIVIGIGKLFVLSKPIPLAFIDESTLVPQSFKYLSPSVLEVIKNIENYSSLTSTPNRRELNK